MEISVDSKGYGVDWKFLVNNHWLTQTQFWIWNTPLKDIYMFVQVDKFALRLKANMIR